MMHFEHFVVPSSFQCPCSRRLEGDVIQKWPQAPRVRQFAQVAETCFNTRRPHHREGLQTIAVGNVSALEKEERKAEDVITMGVRHQNRSHIGGRTTRSSERCQGRWGSVNEVHSVHERHRMEPATREEGVSRSQQVEPRRHALRHTLGVMDPSLPVGRRGVANDDKEPSGGRI